MRFCIFAVVVVVVGVASAGFGCGAGGGSQSSQSGPGSGGAGAGGPGASTGAGNSGAGTGSSSGGSGPGAGGGSTGSGIAAKHPGDVGIENDPDVIFFDDFEPYSQANDLYAKWDAIYQVEDIHFATDPANVFAGHQSLEFTLPQEDAELSDGTDKVLAPERDVLFLRYYGKFQPPYDVVGSSHNGSSISAHYFVNGMATPGIPADGTNKFLVNLENWRGDAMTPSPGDLNNYVYHPEQRSMWGDHFFPTGDVSPYSPTPFDFGPDFVSRPNVIPDLDKWYCYEYMVKANTPGQRDGQITIWLDGKLVADFGNLRFRDIPTLTIDRFGLSFHIYSNPNGPSKKWYDNVVAAKSYIGPMVQP
jgi:hypothetical protein